MHTARKPFPRVSVFPYKSAFQRTLFAHLEVFFALAVRQNDYLNTVFTRDTTPFRVYQKYDPFYLQFGLLHPPQMDVDNQSHIVNRTKMLHTINIYLFVQHHVHRTNPLIHIKARLQKGNTKITSPSYLFITFYARRNSLILVPIEHLHYVETPRSSRYWTTCWQGSHISLTICFLELV